MKTQTFLSTYISRYKKLSPENKLKFVSIVSLPLLLVLMFVTVIILNNTSTVDRNKAAVQLPHTFRYDVNFDPNESFVVKIADDIAAQKANDLLNSTPQITTTPSVCNAGLKLEQSALITKNGTGNDILITIKVSNNGSESVPVKTIVTDHDIKTRYVGGTTIAPAGTNKIGEPVLTAKSFSDSTGASGGSEFGQWTDQFTIGQPGFINVNIAAGQTFTFSYKLNAPAGVAGIFPNTITLFTPNSGCSTLDSIINYTVPGTVVVTSRPAQTATTTPMASSAPLTTTGPANCSTGTELTKSASVVKTASNYEVTYTVQIKQTGVIGTKLGSMNDYLPNNFRYVEGSFNRVCTNGNCSGKIGQPLKSTIYGDSQTGESAVFDTLNWSQSITDPNAQGHLNLTTVQNETVVFTYKVIAPLTATGAFSNTIDITQANAGCAKLSAKSTVGLNVTLTPTTTPPTTTLTTTTTPTIVSSAPVVDTENYYIRGKLVAGNGGFNTKLNDTGSWNWHLDPATVTLVPAIVIPAGCYFGTPSNVESNINTLVGKDYCAVGRFSKAYDTDPTITPTTTTTIIPTTVASCSDGLQLLKSATVNKTATDYEIEYLVSINTTGTANSAYTTLNKITDKLPAGFKYVDQSLKRKCSANATCNTVIGQPAVSTNLETLDWFQKFGPNDDGYLNFSISPASMGSGSTFDNSLSFIYKATAPLTSNGSFENNITLSNLSSSCSTLSTKSTVNLAPPAVSTAPTSVVLDVPYYVFKVTKPTPNQVIVPGSQVNINWTFFAGSQANNLPSDIIPGDITLKSVGPNGTPTSQVLIGVINTQQEEVLNSYVWSVPSNLSTANTYELHVRLNKSLINYPNPAGSPEVVIPIKISNTVPTTMPPAYCDYPQPPASCVYTGGDAYGCGKILVCNTPSPTPTPTPSTTTTTTSTVTSTPITTVITNNASYAFILNSPQNNENITAGSKFNVKWQVVTANQTTVSSTDTIPTDIMLETTGPNGSPITLTILGSVQSNQSPTVSNIFEWTVPTTLSSTNNYKIIVKLRKSLTAFPGNPSEPEISVPIKIVNTTITTTITTATSSTINANCLCQSATFTCSDACSSILVPASGFNYKSPMSCARESFIGAAPSETDRNAFCNRAKRTTGDADGKFETDPITKKVSYITEVDYAYYVKAVNTSGSVQEALPGFANPDFNGDGVISPSDKAIILQFIDK